jgi:hypothetical protein
VLLEHELQTFLGAAAYDIRLTDREDASGGHTKG